MSCGREEFPREGRNKNSLDPSSGYATREEKAPILLVRSVKCVCIPLKRCMGPYLH